MRVLLALLVAAAAASAQDALPLGGYARAGVPLLVEGSGVVTLDGWPFRLDGPTLTHAPRVPCSLADGAGREMRRLEPVPEGRLLVGFAGARPPDLEWGASVVVVSIRAEVLAPAHWRALDLFDRVVVSGSADLPPAASGALARWAESGGSVVRGEDLVAALAEAGPVVPLAMPRWGNVVPEVYDLAPRDQEGGGARRSAALVVAAAAAVLAVQLLLGAAGVVGRRLFWGGLAAILLAGTGIGLLAPAARWSPSVRATIEVDYGVRTRIVRVDRAVGPGARAEREPDATPLFYRSAGEAWWPGAGAPAPVPEGFMRAFVRDAPGPAEAAAGQAVEWRERADWRAFGRRAAPDGWEVAGAWRGKRGGIRFRVVPQR